MTVEAILRSKGNAVFTIRPENSAGEAAALMSSRRVGVAVVCDVRGQVIGVVSERDIVAGISQFGKGIVDIPVRNLMSSPVVTCAPSDPAKKVLEVMSERRIRHLPVVERGELIGLVSIGDAVSYRLRQTQLEAAVLRDFAAVR